MQDWLGQPGLALLDVLTSNMEFVMPPFVGATAEHGLGRNRAPGSAYAYFAHGPKGGMSRLGLSGKFGGRFSKKDLMPSCASAPAAR